MSCFNCYCIKVSIIPFDGADGYTIFKRKRDYKTNDMYACIITFVAGGVGERIFFDSALGDESDQRIAMGLAKTVKLSRLKKYYHCFRFIL